MVPRREEEPERHLDDHQTATWRDLLARATKARDEVLEQRGEDLESPWSLTRHGSRAIVEVPPEFATEAIVAYLSTGRTGPTRQRPPPWSRRRKFHGLRGLVELQVRRARGRPPAQPSSSTKRAKPRSRLKRSVTTPRSVRDAVPVADLTNSMSSRAEHAPRRVIAPRSPRCPRSRLLRRRCAVHGSGRSLRHSSAPKHLLRKHLLVCMHAARREKV